MMNPLIILSGIIVLLILYIWVTSNARKMKERIERIRRIHGPEAKICYMDVRGKRHTWQITIESARLHGQDWVVTAWCHEKKEFLIFHASRIYEYVDLNRIQEIKNIQDYFSERFGPAKNRQKAHSYSNGGWY